MHVFKRNKWLLPVFVGPALILYTYFIIGSTLYSFYYSLTEWDAVSSPVFKGFLNYANFFQDKDFAIVMVNTFKGWFFSLAVQVPCSLIVAYLIYRTFRGFRIYRSLVFLPVVLAPAAIAMMFTLVFNADIGPVNKVLEAVGLGMFKHNWLSDAKVVFYSVLTPMIYQYIGLYVVILLAGMQSIPEEIIESAVIDGASSFRTFINIIIPTQWDIILMCIIMVTTGSFKAFEHSYIMTWGGPGVRSAFLGVYMYNATFKSAEFGKGCAIAMVILVASLILTIISQRITKRFDY